MGASKLSPGREKSRRHPSRLSETTLSETIQYWTRPTRSLDFRTVRVGDRVGRVYFTTLYIEGGRSESVVEYPFHVGRFG